MVKRIETRTISEAYETMVNIMESVYDNVELTSIKELEPGRYAFSFLVEKDGAEMLVLTSISNDEIIIQY